MHCSYLYDIGNIIVPFITFCTNVTTGQTRLDYRKAKKHIFFERSSGTWFDYVAKKSKLSVRDRQSASAPHAEVTPVRGAQRGWLQL